MIQRHRTLSVACLLLSASLLSCQAPAQPPSARTAGLPESLTAPQGSDWSLQHISGRELRERQAASLSRRVQAFPTASWAAGIDLVGYGCSPTDSLPNGPAIAYPAWGQQLNKLFWLSKEGKLIRVDRQTPTSFAALDLGKTFSRTAITLSPATSRAYVLSDDGTLFVVDTATMATLASFSVAGGRGIAPAIDRHASAPDDSLDVLYVPAGDGSVRVLRVEKTAAGVTLTPGASHPVAPGSGIAAPAVVVAGVIYVGDMAGVFHAYDTANPAGSVAYDLGAPIHTAPALELQDGSYAPTDAAGNPVEVPHGQPVHAFVSAGASCAWVNLHDTSVAYSQPLRIDDNDATRHFGYLRDYAFSTAGTTERLALADGGNLNTESPDRDLPGYAAPRSNDHLVPAETNTYEEGGLAKGGPVRSYMRWRSGAAHPQGTLISQATLSLTPAFDQACRAPRVKTSSAFEPGSGAPWSSATLSNAARPMIGPDVGRYLSGGVSGPAGNVLFRTRKAYQWDVSSAFSTPREHYALALTHDAGGDAVLWPEGPVGGGVGKRAKKDYQVEAVKFRSNPLNADPAPATDKDARPTLTLTIAATKLPTATLETPPVIDSLNKRVYVFYTNALYSISFAGPEAWSDTDPTGARHTLFNLAHDGRAASGGGATHLGKQRFVGNFTAPLLGHGASAAYVVSRYPAPDGDAPTTWRYALNKINLPLSPTSDQLVAGSPTFAATAAGASHAMLLDPLNKFARSGSFYFGMGGKLFKYDM